MDDVKFYYIVKNVPQLDFEGRQHIVEVPEGECHIVYQERTMCGKNREKGKRHDGRKAITVKTRPLGVTLCKVCEEKYKANSQSDWRKWVDSESPKKAQILSIDEVEEMFAEAFKDAVFQAAKEVFCDDKNKGA